MELFPSHDQSPPSLNSIYLFLPFELEPSVIGNVFGEPELPAEDKVTVTIPLIASSIKSKLVLVVSPQVPLWVPVSIFSIPKLVVYVLGIYAALLQFGVCSGSTSVHVGL